jgi:2-hydroxy-3-keto-5-methylthiopentenyl-1-phosphate phosphatase
MKSTLAYSVFTDFDATITLEDIGDNLFREFGEYETCVENYRKFRAGELDARECWRRNCATLHNMTLDAFNAYVDSVGVDGSFALFAEYCRNRAIPLTIVSDGFDAYITRVLAREGLSSLPVFSNRAVFGTGGEFQPSFPYTDAECLCCANCKRNHVLTRTGEEHVIVYIGDGFSDCCPARFADVVYAKHTLLKFCENENITYHRFESFRDVLKNFKHMVETTAPHKRRTAVMARNDIFMQG